MSTALQITPPQAKPFADYAALAAGEIRERTLTARHELGDRLVILGHHYQRESVIEFADFRGDSFKLAQLAASREDAELIVLEPVFIAGTENCVTPAEPSSEEEFSG